MRFTVQLAAKVPRKALPPGMPRRRVGHVNQSLGRPLIRLPPNAKVFPLGIQANPPDDAALLRFPEQGWVVNEGGKEGWAIVGDAKGRKLVVDTILGRHKITPNSPPPGPLPVQAFAPPGRAIETETWNPVLYLAFAKPSTNGAFEDYTARYGSLQEDDRLTLRQKMESTFGDSEMARKNVHAALNSVQLKHMVDLPCISLSSGQTRRLRIAYGLMLKPKMLLLEDPMAGLDAASRDLVQELLGEMNMVENEPRAIHVLKDKGEETLNRWITNVIEVIDGNVWIGSAGEWKARVGRRGQKELQVPEGKAMSKEWAAPIAVMKNVSVTYGEGTRNVLEGVNWVIKPGDKWHLQGANGSGKTTLLAVLLGHHPQSFSLPSESLTLFSQPRQMIATQVLRQLIGHTSPEIFAAFPRNMGLTALEAVGTGYEGVFSRRPLTDEQRTRIMYLLDYFHDYLSASKTGAETNDTPEQVANRTFAHFTAPQQALLVFLRAIVSRPSLLVLDEPTQGVDEGVWAKCVKLLEKEWEEMAQDGKDQAVVAVSHYENEMPWKNGKVLRLVDGQAEVIA